MNDISFRDAASNAVKFWEPGRLIYNLVLLAVVGGYFVVGLPASRRLLTLNLGLSLFVLAVLANVAYCAAYAVDIFAQFTTFRSIWPRLRWLVLIVGTIFAATITRFFAMGIFASAT